MESNIFYRRNLPHYQPAEAIYFVTFRLANSLPKSVVEMLRIEQDIILNQLERVKNIQDKSKKIYVQQKIYFGKFDKLLDSSENGDFWLMNEKIAELVTGSIHFYDNDRYFLYCFCLMPNHVHMLFKGKESMQISIYQVTKILQDLKKFTAKEANKILNRKGQFWHKESYDHVVRNKTEFIRIFNYIIQNPVKAKLVKNWKEWKWTYYNPRFSLYIE